MKRLFSALIAGAAGLAWSLSVLEGAQERDASRAVAAQDQVPTVGKDGLKIEGAVKEDDAKIKFKPDPNKDFSAELPGKFYQVKIPSGMKCRIDLVGKGFDPVLVLQDATGNQLAWDDDGGEGLNSRLLFTASKEGTYKVAACTLNGAGSFVLTFTPAGEVKLLDVGKGIKVDGQLNKDNKGVQYFVKMTENKTYVISMTSTDKLDPFLRVLDGSGKELAKDDDSGGGLNARLEFRAPATGTFQVLATSFLGFGEGQFTLEIVEK